MERREARIVAMRKFKGACYHVQKSSFVMRDGVSVDIRIFSPSEPPFAAVVYVHGGAFASGDCDSEEALSSALAKMQMAVISSSYRQGPSFQHPSALNDLADITLHARFKLWPELPIGIVGSSSGGFHALMLSREPPKDLPYAFCIAITPVAHPGLRAAFLKACIRGVAAKKGYNVVQTPLLAAEILAMQTSYFQQESAMHQAGDSLRAPGKHHHRPTRTLLILGSRDASVPRQVTAAVQGWASKSLVLLGLGHEIGIQPPLDAEHSYIPDIVEFAQDAAMRVRLDMASATASARL